MNEIQRQQMYMGAKVVVWFTLALIISLIIFCVVYINKTDPDPIPTDNKSEVQTIIKT